MCDGQFELFLPNVKINDSNSLIGWNTLFWFGLGEHGHLYSLSVSVSQYAPETIHKRSRCLAALRVLKVVVNRNKFSIRNPNIVETQDCVISALVVFFIGHDTPFPHFAASGQVIGFQQLFENLALLHTWLQVHSVKADGVKLSSHRKGKKKHDK